MITRVLTRKKTFFFFISSLLYIYLGYYVNRGDSLFLIGGYLLSFYLSYRLVLGANTTEVFWMGLGFRILFLCSLPLLSQDFYRFIWDGLLWNLNLNPYAYTPNELMENTVLFRHPLKLYLHDQMGELSAMHYSNYPPLNQLGFAFSTWINPNSILAAVIVMRLLIIGADIGIFFFAKSTLSTLKLPSERIGLYYLNPLVIVELTGNLHWEGVMLFFFIMGIWLLQKNFSLWAIISLAASVAVKLIPLYLVAVFSRYFNWKKSLTMGFLGLLFCGLFFLPFFYSIGLDNYLSTLQLWFNRFEFNGSIYYLIRSIGYQVKGYNIIRQLGQVTPFILVGLVILVSLIKKKNTLNEVFMALLFLLSFYYFIASIVHPWYIVSLVLFSIFTPYRFALVWSALIPLSYSAYGNDLFLENYWLISLEYGLVFTFLYRELNGKMSLLKHFK